MVGANPCPNGGEHHALSQHHAHDVAAFRAERHANAELAASAPQPNTRSLGKCRLRPETVRRSLSTFSIARAVQRRVNRCAYLNRLTYRFVAASLTALPLVVNQPAAQLPTDAAAVLAHVVPVTFAPELSHTAKQALTAAIGNRRIVLLGENGHGVGQFTAAKVEIVKFLHQQLGFDVIAFESGFDECRSADEHLTADTVIDAMRSCLLAAFHHRELIPLFDHVAGTRASPRLIHLAGIDFQVQNTSRQRSARFADVLRSQSASRADQLLALDSAYVEKSFGSTDEKVQWVREHGRNLKQLLDEAAAVSKDSMQWAITGASELMRRELARSDALAAQQSVPAAFYEIRDEWMARSVGRLIDADSKRRVVVWMHNDHARYGSWEQGDLRIRATGYFIREKLGDAIYSIGLLMGSGTFADNSRRERPVAEAPPDSIERLLARTGAAAAFLPLTNTKNEALRRWADGEHPYIRGSSVATMRPGREFDALLYIDKVSPPSFKLTR